MRKSFYMILFCLFAGLVSSAQKNELPIKEWNSNTQNPLIIYISGDGGFNDFSTGLCSKISHAGFSVTAINARSYFWKKKTALQAATDFTTYLEKQLNGRKDQQWILVGYSFGADVSPFIVNSMPIAIRQKLLKVILLAPSTSTDFEVHLTDMLSGNKKRTMDVVQEINKMGLQKTISLFSSEDKEFPIKKITLEKYTNIYLPGNHHFDGNIEEVANMIIRHLN